MSDITLDNLKAAADSLRSSILRASVHPETVAAVFDIISSLLSTETRTREVDIKALLDKVDSNDLTLRRIISSVVDDLLLEVNARKQTDLTVRSIEKNIQSTAESLRKEIVDASGNVNFDDAILSDDAPVVALVDRAGAHIVPRTSADAVSVSVGNGEQSLQGFLFGKSKVSYSSFTESGKFVHVSTGAITPDEYFSYLDVTVNPGDKVLIHTNGGANGRAYIFFDDKGAVISSAPSSGEIEALITVPDNAARLVLNCRSSGYDYFSCTINPDSKSESLVDRLNKVAHTVETEVRPLVTSIDNVNKRLDSIKNDELFEYADIEMNTGVKPSNYNTARIVADTLMSYRDGDVLQAVAITMARNMPNTTPSEIKVYDAEDTLVRSVTLDVVNQEGTTLFDLSEYGITLAKGYKVAVKGVGYANRPGENRFYDFNTKTQINDYAYSFEVRVARKVFDKSFFSPSISSALETSVSLSDKVDDICKMATPSLKVLCFGNSFTQNSMGYVPFVLHSLLPDLQLTLAVAHIDSCSMAQHCASITGRPVTLNDKSYVPKIYSIFKFTPGAAKWVTSPIKEATDIIVDEDWDIVTFQLNGSDAFKDFDIYIKPFLAKCHAAVATMAKAPVRFGWLLTHGSYSADADTCHERWKGTAENAVKVMQSTATSVLFPYGTAVENLRSVISNVGDDGPLLVDSIHLQEGLGWLVAAYANALVILREAGYFSKTSMFGDKTRPSSEWCRTINAPGTQYGSPTVAGISDTSCMLAAAAAHAAVLSPYANISLDDYVS